MKKKKLGVNIREAGKDAFLIDVKDEFSSQTLAVTLKELKQLIRHGMTILKSKNK